ncbi:hypothetical protein V1264_004600 [Littorina saxatilis]|uniref:Uncharacterized protein n=1 Tax=Littorina saxatilis TaxID=31220 RepID=A0AAN9G7L8_9CAEN
MGNSGSKRARGFLCSCVTCQKHRAHPQELNEDSHKAQTTSWLPPRENWTGTSGLPFGWETGVDKNDKDYFINHVDRYTTRDDPRQDPDYIEPPRPREVELVRDLEKGFGFVAGSEKPVVVRFVTEGGPSENKLLPGDQILKINGEEVRRAPREKVIELVRSCKEAILLTVCQPYTDNSNRKSALLTAAKKAKLKNNPSRVRFADAVMVNGASITNPSPVESYVPFMPNVLKVFLENGQTKSFKYDNKTTVKDVVASLQEKLNIRCANHFNLVLQNMKNNTGTAAKMTLLQDHETLAEIAARQGARYFRCLFRVTFVPKDAYDLLKEDPIAFEYFYLQCCNDVLHERFASEMKYDTALRLAALQIQQHAMSNNMGNKISIKAVIKECGLDKFVSKSLMDSMKGKDLKRMLTQYLKMNQSLAAPGQKQLSALQAKLHYMKIVGELKTFGSRVFMVTLLDKKTEAMLLVGPHSGVSIVTNIKSYALTQLADFEHLEQVKVTKDGDNMHRVDLKVKGQKTEDISLGLLSEDAQNFVCLVAGYYRIFVDPEKRLVERTIGKNTTDPDVPSYEDMHKVHATPWSYPEDLVSETVGSSDNGVSDNQRLVDLATDPPEYEQDEQYLAQVKEDLGIQMDETAAMSAAERPKNISTINVTATSPFPARQVKVNGADSPFEEGVTSFGTASSDSSSLSSFSSQPLPATAGLSSQPVLNSTIDLRRTIAAANGQVAMVTTGRNGSGPGSSSSSSSPPSIFLDTRGESERSSDTDSVSTLDNTERRPLLGPSNGSSGGSGGAGVTQNGDVRHSGGDAESDDTDSFGTPSGSPAKARLIQRVSSIESGMHSFGLHSPDMMPAADVDFRRMSEEDLNRLPPDVYSAIYQQQDPAGIIPPQKLYLDPDIIDLTIFPLPESTTDDESMIDFTAMPSVPPPSFANSVPPSSCSASDPSSQQRHASGSSDFSNGYPGSRSTGQPGLMRSASAGHCPDFFDSDIDSLIAQYYVPPPPSSSGESDSAQSQVLSHSFSGAIAGSFSSPLPDSGGPLDDDFSSLIIPPPPSSSPPQTEDVAVVPPVPADSKVKRRQFRHKRSSSVDIGSLNLANQQLEESEKRRSLDGQDLRSEHEDSIRRSSPPHDLGGGRLAPDSHSHDGLVAESPATVSLKLHNLLKSLPNFAPEVAMANQPQQFHRTGSLRIHRSSSLDLVPVATSVTNGAQAAQAFTGKATHRTLFSGAASLGRNSGRLAVSHEQLATSSAVPGASSPQDSSQQQQSATESFASLKAKLKDYRDYLLKRSSHSRKNSDDSGSESGEKKKSSLRRSNSFSRLFSQLSGSRRGSKTSTSSDPVVVGNDNWTLKQRSGRGVSSSTGDLQSLFYPPGSEEEKRGTPVVLENFAVARTSLRPVSTSGPTQNKTKKSGPLKALSSVFASDEKTSDRSLRDSLPLKPSSPTSTSKPTTSTTTTTTTTSSPSKLSSSKKFNATHESKDDLSVGHKDGRKKKTKVQANPYATLRMWRPITMTSSVSHDEDVYHNFSNFEVLMAAADEAKLPVTGDLRNEDFLSSTVPPPSSFSSNSVLSRTISHPITATEYAASNLTDSVPPDYYPHPSPSMPRQRSVSYVQSNGSSEVVKTRVQPRRAAPPPPSSVRSASDASVGRAGLNSAPSSAVTIPLKTRSLSINEHPEEEEAGPVPPPRRSRQQFKSSAPPPPVPPPSSSVNGGGDIPADYPHDSSSSYTGSMRSRSSSRDGGGSRERRDSSERRGRSVTDSSCAVVSPEVTKSVRSVLSKTYGPEGFEAAAQDVENLLIRLKDTMETLKTWQGHTTSSASQFHTVKQELQLQTKQFVQDAKLLVAGATGSREAVSQHMNRAMHTLARVFLHSQATMVRMHGVHQAQHVGFEVLKVSASFKSTVAAANAAMGKPTTDPHMKYLMRQATNLAGLLSTLLKTLKTLEQV